MGVTGRPRCRSAAVVRALRRRLDGKSLLEQNVGMQRTTLAHKRLTAMLAHDAEVGNAPPLQDLLGSLLDFVRQAAADGLPAHEVERRLFADVLAIGRQAFALFLRLQG